MTTPNFDARYQLLKCVAVADGIRTHNALEQVTGRVVMVHLVDAAGPDEVEALQAKLGRLPQSDKTRILEIATVPAGFAVVTEFLQGLINFSDWLAARILPEEPTTDVSDVSRVSNEQVRPRVSQVVSATAATAVPAPNDLSTVASSVPPPPRGPASPLTASIVSSVAAPVPAPEPAPVSAQSAAPASPSQAGEFTSLFGALTPPVDRDKPEASGSSTPFAPHVAAPVAPAPVTAPLSTFAPQPTNSPMLRAAPELAVGSVTPAAVVPPVPPAAYDPPIQPVPPTLPAPSAPLPTVPDEPAGEFTRLFQPAIAKASKDVGPTVPSREGPVAGRASAMDRLGTPASAGSTVPVHERWDSPPRAPHAASPTPLTGDQFSPFPPSLQPPPVAPGGSPPVARGGEAHGDSPLGASPMGGAFPIGSSPIGSSPMGSSPSGGSAPSASPFGAGPSGTSPAGPSPFDASPSSAPLGGTSPFGARASAESPSPVPLSSPAPAPRGVSPLGSSPFDPSFSPSLPSVLPAPVFANAGLGTPQPPLGPMGARQEAAPGVYTQFIRQSVTPAPILPAAPKPAAAAPSAQKRTIPLGLIIALNAVLVLAIVLVVYFVFRTPPSAALPGGAIPSAPAVPSGALPTAPALPKPAIPSAPAAPTPQLPKS